MNELDSGFSANLVSFMNVDETKLYINKDDDMLVLSMAEMEELHKVIHSYFTLKTVSNCYVSEENS